MNPGPLAPKARIIPLDHWAIYKINRQIIQCKLRKASIAQWQSVGLVNQRSWVQSSLEAKKFFWPRRDSNTQPSDLESDALPLRHGVNFVKVPPRFELGSLDSKSRVLTITPWNLMMSKMAKLCYSLQISWLKKMKNNCFLPGSNRRPCACEAHVITTTLRKPMELLI